jgi:hypothetical protein
MTNENAKYGEDDVIGAHLSETDQNLLRAWYEHLILLDPRYSDKRVRKLGARAMVDDEFRRGLVGDAGTAASEGESESPDRVDVRFHTNTTRTLHVVLPPKAGATENFPTPLRDALRSRTSDAAGFLQDDWNISDPDSLDHPNRPPGDGLDGRDGSHPVDGVDTWDTIFVVA